jgi:transcriptional regulator with GAF, ATPase, and Fis domain
VEADGQRIVIASKKIKTVISGAERAVDNDVTVLLLGESGVGKEVIARFIHESGPRGAGPFIAVNCGAVPEALFEAEFFGYERGAFTNAFTTHKGFFEQANNGTILLDEISELPLAMQVKLLRVLEHKYVVRIGGEQEIPIDARVIATSNRDLQSLVRQGKFRQDLYFRLVVWVIYIPPLRERKEDIKALADYFIGKYGGDGIGLSDEAVRKLYSYEWPGNVRELESCIVRAILARSKREFIDAEDIQEGWEAMSADTPSNSIWNALDHLTLTQIHHVVIKRRLQRYRGNKSKTAPQEVAEQVENNVIQGSAALLKAFSHVNMLFSRVEAAEIQKTMLMTAIDHGRTAVASLRVAEDKYGEIVQIVEKYGTRPEASKKLRSLDYGALRKQHEINPEIWEELSSRAQTGDVGAILRFMYEGIHDLRVQIESVAAALAKGEGPTLSTYLTTMNNWTNVTAFGQYSAVIFKAL